MKDFFRISIILISMTFGLFLIVPIQVLCEVDPIATKIEKMVQEMDSLIKKRELDQALVIGEKALNQAQKTFGNDDPIAALVLNALGQCYHDQANYGECESIWKEALSIREQALGKKHLLVAQSQNNLAILYNDLSRYEEAEVLFKQALAIREKALGPDSPDLAKTLNNLANLHWKQGRYTEAEALLERAISIIERTLGLDHPDLADCLENMGLVFRGQAKFAEAENFLNRALEIREKSFGPDHPDVASSYNRLALLYLSLGREADVESFTEQALEIRRKILGPEHPDVAGSLIILAILYQGQGKYIEAEVLHIQALDIREKSLGPEHHRVADSLNNLGRLYHALGRYIEAESLYERALAIREKVLGPNHPDVNSTLSSQGSLCLDQDKYVKAELLLKRALDISEKILGPEHLYTTYDLNNLAGLYERQGRYAEAENLYNQSLKIFERILGPDSSYAGIILNNLAALYNAQGKFADAESLYKRALTILEKNQRPEHPNVGISLNNLAVSYVGQGKFADAEPLYKQALTILEKDLGPEHPHVSNSIIYLAVLFESQGKYADAEPYYERALAICEESLRPEHSISIHCLSRLANFYGSLGKFDKSLSYYQKLQQFRQYFIEDIFTYASENQKMRYIEKYPLINHALLSFAVMTNPVKSISSEPEMTFKDKDEAKNLALEMALKSKAFVMDAISFERQIAYYSDEPLTQENLRELRGICGEIATLTLSGWEKLDPKIYRKRLEDLYQKKDFLETELSAGCAAFRDELALKKFSPQDVAEAIPPGSVLWEFLRYKPYDFAKIGSDKEKTGPPRYLAFTMNHQGEITLTDLGDAKAIDELVHAARERIEKDKSRGYLFTDQVAESEKRLRKITGELHDRVFAPLASQLDGNIDILIAPDGQLNLIPFEILVCSDGRFVIEKFRISYLSTGRDLLRFKRKQESTQWAMLMADPAFNLSGGLIEQHRGTILDRSSDSLLSRAPSRNVSDCYDFCVPSLDHSGEEIVAIRESLETKAGLEVRSYTGREALEEVLKYMPTAPKVLHLATHGFFCEDVDPAEKKFFENPLLRCGLLLTGSNQLRRKTMREITQKDDGILTAFEASGLNLMGTELVTLSACETGLGDVKSGEGVFGLRRAFQHAGARTIVMSLWKVPDNETCELMRYFYRNWSSGHSKRAALRQAVLKILDKKRGTYAAHPYFWGAFVMVGDPF